MDATGAAVVGEMGPYRTRAAERAEGVCRRRWSREVCRSPCTPAWFGRRDSGVRARGRAGKNRVFPVSRAASASPPGAHPVGRVDRCR